MQSIADLPSLFRRVAAGRPEAPAILVDGDHWTYARLDRASDGVAAGLAERGINPGDRVALYCPNGAEFVVAYLGILKAGAVVVPVNLLLNPREITFMLGDAGVRGLCFHAALADKAGAALEEADLPLLRIGIGFDDDSDLVDCHLHRMAPAPDAEPPPATAINAATAPAVILYTSGTTGRPKGAVLTHANLASNARAVADTLELRPDSDRILVVLPMFHAFAGTVGILTPLLCGAALVPVPRFDPQVITEAIGRHRATVFLGVPSLYAVLLRLGDEQLARWASVRLCISGGAAMPVALMQAFEQRFRVPVLEGDGPTECGPVTAVNPPAGPRKPGSIGPPIRDVEMHIADEQGNWLADGEHGEVCVRGPSVMQGYWGLPEATAQSFFGDWFRTGDLGWRDADGYFYLVDRIKDLIISNGMNVYPRVIEEVLIRHPSVVEAAVVGEPHPIHGEIPIAYVTSAPDSGSGSGSGSGAAAAALKAWCREHLGSHEIPRRIEIVAALPKNAAGKILKRELRRSGEVERGVR
ncbi:long-chain-fatty-acid--CoA ligase [Thiohalocapsa marina]|uniref:long-chain-fatty-acid--CoA ligase n=1 Tax=Thiohalocapsa marina TaxID=424902 RepID=UPI0036DBF41E